MRTYYKGENYLKSLTRQDILGGIEPLNRQNIVLINEVEDYTDYRNNSIYKIRIIGVTPYGTKVCIMVTGIDVFVDVYVEDIDMNELTTILADSDIEIEKFEDITGYPLFGYNKAPNKYKRIYTVDLANRKKVITLLRNKGYSTANDDQSCYYRKVSRDYNILYAELIEINGYLKYDSQERYLTGEIDISNIKQYTGEITSNMKKERTLVTTFDIETYSNADTGDLPVPSRSTDWMFMICLTTHITSADVDSDAIYKVCIVDKDIPDDETTDDPNDPNYNVHTIVCGNEENIIRAFGLVMHNISPDFLIGFNDAAYDHMFIFERAKMYSILGWLYNKISLISKPNVTDSYVYERMIMRRDVKISPEERMHCEFLKCVGIIPLDIRVCFKKLFKKEEVTKGSSLNFYLKINNLALKVDLPHTEMHKIYKDCESSDDDIKKSSLARMSLVRKYCIIDSMSCFRLFVKQMILPTLRENANMSYITIMDEHLCAGSMKVCNKVIAEGLKLNILCSNITKEKSLTDKFSGAHVFHPEKGLETSRPVMAQDFKSLYPSIIMAYNLSPEKFVSSEDYASELIKDGKSIYELPFEYAGEHRVARFVRHDSKSNQFGLIPKILKELFDTRVAIQRSQETIDRNDPEGEFEYNRLKIKQGAIKVFMNSIYGVSGMDISPLFLLEQAVTITSSGKILINKVAEFVRNKGYFVKYGDTDSVYLRPPNEYFKELDNRYKSAEITKLEYWTEMVKISDTLSEDIRDEINEYLKEIVGNGFVYMANEEVKFPVIFTGKKKYAGIAHYHDKHGKLVVDFYPKKLFIKGIDIIKEGQPQLAITMGTKILRSIVDVNKPPDITVLDVVREVFNDAIENKDQWTMDDFIQSDSYRPNKDNKTVQKFVARMKERYNKEVEANKQRLLENEPLEEYLYEPPAPGERFKYIVVKQLEFYNLKGLKINMNKGDLMEYVHVVKKLNLEIDIAEYLSSKVAGICARFINYDFTPEDTDTTEYTMKEIDEYAQKHAKKYLERLLDQYVQPKVDHFALKRAYKKAEKAIKNQLGDKYELLESLQTINKTGNAKEELLKTVTDLVNATKLTDIKIRNIEMLQQLGIDKDGTDIGDTKATNVYKYFKVFKNIINNSRSNIDLLINEMNLDQLMSMLTKYDASFEQIVMLNRNGSTNDNLSLLNSSEHEQLDNFKQQFNQLTSNMEKLIADQNLHVIIMQLREKRLST